MVKGSGFLDVYKRQVLLSMGLIFTSEINSILKTSLWGLGSGILSSILTIGTLPVWENIFNVITPAKLLELSTPNHPLLKKLLLEAPGTYHHSILVGNLAERAIEYIGGNSLLARVGAYYHDVGKLKRPYFFKENQVGPENPHNKITPNLSTLTVSYTHLWTITTCKISLQIRRCGNPYQK